jgi:ribosomal protein L23
MTLLIKGRVLTEKAAILLEENGQYIYDVDARLTKTQIKLLFKHVFGVDMTSIRTHKRPLKKLRGRSALGYRPRYKRVIFTIRPTDMLPWEKEAAERAAARAAAADEKATKKPVTVASGGRTGSQTSRFIGQTKEAPPIVDVRTPARGEPGKRDEPRKASR